jgi:phage/plasmid-like protein (TIGR03299 family)
LARAAGSSDMTVETAGTLGQGETVWLLASIPSMTFGRGDDMNKAYLLFKNSHDGSGKFVAMPTMIRVVCQNTLRMALGADAKGRVSKSGTVSEGYAIRHTSKVEQALVRIADAFAQTRRDFQQTATNFQALTAKPLTDADWHAMIGSAWPKPQEDKVEAGSVLDSILAGMESRHAAASERSRAEAMAQARMDRLEEILASGTCRTKGTEGTLWSGLQAITEYCDHESRTRVTGNSTEQSQRFESALFGGTADQTKARVYETAVQLARA